MPKFIIERDIPGAGALSAADLKAISQESCAVLASTRPHIQWAESFVTDDQVYCGYIAPDEAAIREQASMGGFPANRTSHVKTVIGPTTAK